jgi:hypothetical protein
MTTGHELYLEIIKEFDYKISLVKDSMQAAAIRFAETGEEKFQQQYNNYKMSLEYMSQCKTSITSRGGVFARLENKA